MEPELFSHAHLTDEQINELVQRLRQRRQMRQGLADAPDLRLTWDLQRAYHTEYEADRRSLEHVFTRLLQDAAEAESIFDSFPQATDPQQEGIISMQQATETLRAKANGYKRKHPGSLLVAILCLALLTGGFFITLDAIHAGGSRSGSGQATTPSLSNTASAATAPSTQATPGPASNIITSAAISNTIDARTGQIYTYVNHFVVDQTIWVACNVTNPPFDGKVFAKWYTNGNLYKISYINDLILANTSKTAVFSIAYAQPAEGKVEIYWSDVNGKHAQLAMTLLFVVQPAK